MSAAGVEALVAEPRFEGDCSLPGTFALEAGGTLSRPVLHYALYGQPPAEDNVALVCHALSGSARVADWWPALFAAGGLLDLHRDCVLGINILGSCYGSTGPSSLDPETGEAYGVQFPLVTIGDMVRAQAMLLDALGIRRLRLAIGASIGGMQVLDWSIRFPQRVKRGIAIGAAPLGPVGLALNHLQRAVIRLDPEWRKEGAPAGAAETGLSLARQIATYTYKSPQLFAHRFGRRPDRSGEDPYRDTDLDGEGRFDVAGYLDYQGERFRQRFEARSYVAITRAMDLFDPAREYGDALAAYRRIQAELILVGISSDLLFPPEDVRSLARTIGAAGVRCRYRELVSGHGHDAFLAEPARLFALLREDASETQAATTESPEQDPEGERALAADSD